MPFSYWLIALLGGVCSFLGGWWTARTLADQNRRPDIGSWLPIVGSLGLCALGLVAILLLRAQGYWTGVFSLLGLGVVANLIGVALYKPKVN